MLRGTWRVLKPGGLFFCRLASSIGMEDQVRRIDGRRHDCPTVRSATWLMRNCWASSPQSWAGDCWTR